MVLELFLESSRSRSYAMFGFAAVLYYGQGLVKLEWGRRRRRRPTYYSYLRLFPLVWLPWLWFPPFPRRWLSSARGETWAGWRGAGRVPRDHELHQHQRALWTNPGQEQKKRSVIMIVVISVFLVPRSIAKRSPKCWTRNILPNI